jgi:hypothetical protein
MLALLTRHSPREISGNGRLVMETAVETEAGLAVFREREQERVLCSTFVTMR